MYTASFDYVDTADFAFLNRYRWTAEQRVRQEQHPQSKYYLHHQYKGVLSLEAFLFGWNQNRKIEKYYILCVYISAEAKLHIVRENAYIVHLPVYKQKRK